MLNELFFNLLRASWQGSILALLVGAVLLIFGKRISAQVRFLLIGVVLVRLLLPVTPGSAVSVFGLANFVTVSETQGESLTERGSLTIVRGSNIPIREPLTAVRGSDVRNADVPVIAAHGSKRTISWYQFAITIWCGGVLFFAFRLLLNKFQLVRRRKHWQRIESPELRQLIADCRKETGLWRRVEVLTTTEPVGAAACGIFRPIILLSQEMLDTFDTDELRLILLHELLHHKRFDTLTHLLSQIVKVLHWFNPAVYVLVNTFRNERELAVDESVVRLSDRSMAALYGNVILKIFRHYAKIVRQTSSPLLLGVQSQDKLLERRITMILKPASAPLLRMALGILLITGLALTGLTDAQMVQKTTVTESKTADDSAISDGNVLIDFEFVDTKNQPIKEADFYHSYDETFSPENRAITITGFVSFLCPKEKYKNLSVFVLSKDGKSAAWESYDPAIWESSHTKTIKKKMTLYPDVRTITGTVKDSSGKPVEGAYVGGGEEGQLPMYSKSKADGTFLFPYFGSTRLIQVYAVKSGVGFAYHVTEELYGYEGKTPPDKISNGPFHLVLDKPQTVQVRVTDEKGTPIPGAVVYASGVHIAIKKATVPKDYFRPTNFAAPVFSPKTDATGLATFDWIPTTNVQSIHFTAKGPKEAVAQPDGTSKYFGKSHYVDWNKKDPIITATLPQQAKVKIKVVNTDGSPAINVSPFLEWTTKSRPAGGQGVYLDENGEADIFGNVGDVFDIHSVSWDAERFVFPTVGNFNVGNGNEVKELKLTAKKGTKIFGHILDANGKPMKWSDQYYISGWESNNPNVAKQQTQNETFGVGVLQGDTTAFEVYLPAGTFTFKIRLRNERTAEPENRLFDEKTITITDEQEIRLDLRLHK